MEMSTAIGFALERLQFTCLDAWAGNNKTYRFQCSRGHVVTYLGRSLYTLKGCSRCADGGRLLRLSRKAREDGSELLDTQWRGAGTNHYRFRCRKDPTHEWRRIYSFALNNSQCPHCVPRGRKLAADGLQRLREYAHQRGGACLSPAYLGITQAHRFRCGHGHTWEVVAQVVLGSERWCPRCRSIEYTLEDAQRTARERGGVLLSDSYRNVKTRYTWMCSQGHTWSTAYRVVLDGSWCPTCAHMARTTPGSAAWMRYRTHQPRDE